MRVTTAHVCGLLLLGVWLTAGCQTVVSEAPSVESDYTLDAVDPDRDLFAEVLARYASGLIHDMNREYDAALEEYLEAVKLDPENEELHFRIAMGLLHENRAAEAIRMMEDLVARRPKSPNAWTWMALLYRAADRPDQAIESYHRLIELDPSETAPYMDLASYHLRLNQKQPAVDVLTAGTKNAKKPVELYVALGQVHERSATEATTDEDRRTQTDLAIAAYAKASKLDSENVEILLKLGELYIRNQQVSKAVDTYERLERILPEDLKVSRQLALSFIQIGGVEQAVKAIESLSEEQPSNARLHYYLGELLQEQGEIERSIAQFKQATATSRKDPTPYIRLALIQMEDDPMAAIQTLQLGLDRMRENPRLTEILAYAYLDKEEYSQALDWMARAEVLLGDEADGRFYYNYARAAYSAGHRDTVVRYLSKAMSESALYPQSFMHEILSVNDPDLDEAISLFQSLADQNRNEPAVYSFLGLMKSYNEQFAEAVKDFQRVERLVREDRDDEQLLNDEYYFSYAAALERSGRIKDAEEFFLKTLELSPDHSNAHNYLAYMWAERGINLDEALDHVNQALTVTPDSGAFIDTLGWIYYQQGKYDLALVEIQRADELAPDDPTISDHLGDTLQKLDRTDEAIRFWKQSLELDPDNEKVAEKLRGEGINSESARMQEHVEEAPGEPEEMEIGMGPDRVDTALETGLDPVSAPAEDEVPDDLSTPTQ